MIFLILFNADSKAVALHITIIASTLSKDDGSEVALTLITRSPPCPSIFKPSLLIASTCSFQTSIKITFKPFSASNPPNKQPIAPAPSTATFKSLLIIVTLF